MIRFLFTRLILPLILFWVLRYIFKTVADSMRSTAPQTTQKNQPGFQAGGELKKDPVCGTYVVPANAVSRSVNGEVYYFCSPACRDQYKA